MGAHGRADAHVVASVLGQWVRPGALLSAALADALDNAIADGVVPDGGALPSQRQLSAVLGVSRVTVAAAYEILRFSGCVDGAARVVARRSPTSRHSGTGQLRIPDPRESPADGALVLTRGGEPATPL